MRQSPSTSSHWRIQSSSCIRKGKPHSISVKWATTSCRLHRVCALPCVRRRRSFSSGKCAFELAIMGLSEQDQSNEEAAVLYCASTGMMTRGAEKIKKTKSEVTSTLTDSAIATEYAKKTGKLLRPK